MDYWSFIVANCFTKYIIVCMMSFRFNSRIIKIDTPQGLFSSVSRIRAARSIADILLAKGRAFLYAGQNQNVFCPNTEESYYLTYLLSYMQIG